MKTASFIFIIIVNVIFAQKLLIDDYHSWESGAFSEFYDTLRSAGIEIHFTSDEDCQISRIWIVCGCNLPVVIQLNSLILISLKR